MARSVMIYLRDTNLTLARNEYDQYESFYNELCNAEDLSQLLDEDTLKDCEKVKWILVRSIEKKHESIINFLLSRTIKLGILNNHDQTAIHLAAYKYNFEAIKLLFLHYGDSVNYVDDQGLSHFHAACLSDHVSAIKNFLKCGVDVDRSCYYDGFKQIPLQIAIDYNNSKLVKFMLQYGANCNSLGNREKSTLNINLARNKDKIVSFLLKCIGDPNLLFKINIPLFKLIIANVKPNIVRCLLKGRTDPVPLRKLDLPPLHLAMTHHNTKTVHLLLKYGADPNSLTDAGNSPLHLACYSSNLLIEGMINLFAINKQIFWDVYKTIINYLEATYDEEMELIKLLVDYGSNINMKNLSALTPILTILEHKKFNYLDMVYPEQNYNNFMIVNIIQEFYKSQMEKIKFLLNNGADVRVADNDGNTILHLAIRTMKKFSRPLYMEGIYFEDVILAEIITILVQYGADVNAQNKKGQSPLQMAVSTLSFETVKVLLDHKADITNVQFNRINYHSDVVPSLQATDNLFKILNALEEKGFYLDQKNNLSILTFYVHNNLRIPNTIYRHGSAFYIIKNLLELGTDVNIKSSLALLEEGRFHDKKWLKTVKNVAAIQIFKHLETLIQGKIYATKDIKNFLWFKMVQLSSYISNECELHLRIDQELKDMECIRMGPDIFLSDIMRINPERCYWRIKSGDYMSIFKSSEFQSRFPNLLGIIEGHFAKALVRRFVEESAMKCFTNVISPRLPDLCYKLIFDYLSNESLYEFCVAMMR